MVPRLLLLETRAPTDELKIIAATPAFVEKGSSDYAFVQILFGGTSIDPDSLGVTLVYPDGNSTALTATKLSPAVYAIELPGIEYHTTVLLKIDASYWFLDSSSSAAIKVSEIVEKIATLNDKVILSLSTLTEVLQNVEYKVGEIRGDTLTLLPQLGTISIKLSDIDAKIESIDGNVATIKTDVGTIKTSVESISNAVPSFETAVSNISEKLDNVHGLSGKSVTLLYVVIILLIIALILQTAYFFIKK